MNISIVNSTSTGFNHSKLISCVFPQIFQPLIPLCLAWGSRVQITWCPWQVLLDQGNDVSPCSAICNGCGWIHWLAIQRKTRWCCTTWSQTVTEIIEITRAANAWKITRLQSTQSRDGIPIQTEGCVGSLCKHCVGLICQWLIVILPFTLF